MHQTTEYLQVLVTRDDDSGLDGNGHGDHVVAVQSEFGSRLAPYPFAYFPEVRPAIRPNTEPDISPAPPR
jgi:hypothetical protein